jgi:hypothetical protein
MKVSNLTRRKLFFLVVGVDDFDEVGGAVVVQLHVDVHRHFVYFYVHLRKIKK